MGLRFRKTIKICKGVSINLGKTGASISVGPRGLRHTIHTSGKQTTSVGLPRTGLSYVTTKGGGRKNSSGAYAKKQQLMEQRNQASITEAENNRLLVEEYENELEILKSIHKECDEAVDWNALLENPEVKDIAEAVLKGNTEVYLGVIEQMKPLDDLLEYGSEFEFGTDSPKVMEVEFKVKGESVIPDYILSLTSSGALSQKDMPKMQRNELLQDYVCSCAIRISRDICALLPVETVIVHAVDAMLNTATGHMEESTILSVEFQKSILQTLNFDRIDPSDALSNFKHNMKFIKTSGFRTVKRVDEA